MCFLLVGVEVMMDSKIAVCPICGKKTLLRIQNGAYLNEYPIRVNCFNCKTLIKGSYVMNSKSRINGLYLINADIEECFPDTKTLTIPGVDYVAEISGELPCRNVRVYEGGLPISPFLRLDWNCRSWRSGTMSVCVWLPAATAAPQRPAIW